MNQTQTHPRKIQGYGWKRPLPRRNKIRCMIAAPPGGFPPSLDLEPQFPSCYDQGDLGSCTANSLAGAMAFAAIKQGLPVTMFSRLFIYYGERLMEGTVSSDSGASLSDGLEFIIRAGAPAETDWPYDISQFAVKPPAQAYADAVQFAATKSSFIDQNIGAMKACIAAGYPFPFGFTVYESFESQEVASSGIYTMPEPGESVAGGHAVVCVGYDDEKQMVKVRNSWGTGWGQNGYFWMPYAYIENPDLADEFLQIDLVK